MYSICKLNTNNCLISYVQFGDREWIFPVIDLNCKIKTLEHIGSLNSMSLGNMASGSSADLATLILLWSTNISRNLQTISLFSVAGKILCGQWWHCGA